MADISVDNQRDNFNTGPYGDPPFKIKILKIGLHSDLSWPQSGLEPKFHDLETFGGFGKREQTHINTRFMIYKYRFSKLRYLVPTRSCQVEVSWTPAVSY